LSWTKPVTLHDCDDPFDVRRSSNVEDGGHLAEELRAEQTGGDHAEPSRTDDTEVFDLMDAPTGDEQDVASSDSHLVAVQRDSSGAVQSVERFIKRLVRQ
jgi:hypothetical protein